MEREDAGAGQQPERGRKQDRRPLPPYMRVLLSRQQEQGLNHQLRRRILRAIHTGNEPLSATLLCAEKGALAGVPLSTVAYHMNVLVNFGMVREDHTKSRRGATEHFFASEVADDLLVKGVLAEAEELDAAKRDSGGG